MTTDSLKESLDARLAPLRFERFDRTLEVEEATVEAVWRRRTWNSNRAVALLHIDDSERQPTYPGELAQAIKIPLGKKIGYFPFFYGLGLQVIVSGCSLATAIEDLRDYTDKVDNQRSIVQSIHAIDLARGRFQSVRTWGQVVTGRFQDAIEAALEERLERVG